MVYIFSKFDNSLVGKVANVFDARNYIVNELHKDVNDYDILQDVVQNIVSRIVYVDGECVYNSKDFWMQNFEEFLENYEEHEVLDIFGKSINKNRFRQEWLSNSNRIGLIDGEEGQVLYNMDVGFEFITLFRVECIRTEFDYSTGVSPLTIWSKMQHVNIPKSLLTHDPEDTGIIESNIISMLNAGCFREVSQALNFVETDIFLTKERIEKYVDMLNVADAINYSTDKTYYYKLSNEE